MGLGSTECGLFPTLKPDDPLDWNYIHLSPVLGQEYRHVSDNLYEQVIVRKPQLEPFQGVFATFPDLQEYRMRDLYSKHPTKDDNIWLYRGRTDDIIVYSTGEKLNPLDMEDIINSNPAVNAALIFGFGHFQSALLVEATSPPSTEAEKQDILNVIWPSVEAANETCPSFGRIHRAMIAFTTVDKPMLRAGKGTVQRKLTTDLYASELDALYEANNQADSAHSVDGTLSDTNMEDMIRGTIKNATNIDAATISISADLFELGLDSLQATAISKQISRLLSSRGSSQVCDMWMIYANPTIEKLASTITAITEGRKSRPEISPEEQMNKLYTELSADIPLSARTPLPRPSDKLVVLLTGSTGTVGSYILTFLSQDPRISRIYCLNRGPESQNRQKESLLAKELRLTSPDKVTFLDVDIATTRFGLSTQRYMQLLSEVTDVIHNAWQVDFNLSVESFLSHLLALRRFIDFSSHSAFGAHIFFISSISAIGGLRTDKSVPETVFGDDWNVPEPMGYGQSKYIAERLLHSAATEAGIPTTICRVGQVAGPTTASGIWTEREWLPSLVKSCKVLGKIPTALGRMETVNWVPVDFLGQAVVELVTARSNNEPQGAAVYHLINPQQSTWASLMPTVKGFLGVDTEPVSLQAWVESLRESATEAELADLSLNPAIKLLPFFESLLDTQNMPSLLETSSATGASKALASLQSVGEEWMSNWMRQWGY
jgi:thioester reductase-like protein